MSAKVIQTERLDLVLLTADFLQLSLDGDHVTAEGLLGLSIPADWYAHHDLVSLRLAQLRNNPAYQPWSLRAIGLRQQQVMVGHIGFHTKPGAEYLRKIATHGVEFGYSIYPPYRRRGYAREACAALLKWAHEEQGVSEFVVTIAPENVASRRLAEGFGFRQVGTHMDEVDGPEDILMLDFRINHTRKEK